MTYIVFKFITRVKINNNNNKNAAYDLYAHLCLANSKRIICQNTSDACEFFFIIDDQCSAVSSAQSMID